MLTEFAGLVEELGRDAFFSDKETALRTLAQRYGTTTGPVNRPVLDDGHPASNPA